MVVPGHDGAGGGPGLIDEICLRLYHYYNIKICLFSSRDQGIDEATILEPVQQVTTQLLMS